MKHHDREHGRIEVHIDESDPSRVGFSVRDDGPGIPPDMHERVFGMFQTLKSRDEVEGSGIGLAIVAKTVKCFGGEVTVSSEGRGTTFAFTWPRRADSRSEGPAPVTAAEPAKALASPRPH